MRVRLGLGLALAFILPACGGSGSTPDVIPDPPSGAAASPLGATRATVTWNDLSDNEAEFIIETSPDNVVWMEALRVGQNTTSATVSGLAPGTTVYFRISSSNAKGNSAPDGPVMITLGQPVWTPLATGPGELYWTCSAYDPTRRLMLVFGGRDTGLAVHNTLHALHLDTLTWSTILPNNVLPQGRFGSSMIYDPVGDRLIVFGGQVGVSPINVITSEILEFRMSTRLWAVLGTSSGGPTARMHHTAVYDGGFQRMIVYGGDNSGVTFPEVLALSLPSSGLPTWNTFPLSGPAPLTRTRHSAIYDAKTSRMIVFAGADNDLGDGSLAAQDVWSLDLGVFFPTAWTPLTPTGGPPPFRAGHLAAWDSVNDVMIIYSGGDEFETPIDDVWALTLTGSPEWRSYTPAAGPAARQYATGVFDPVNVSLRVFGGALDDTLLGTNDAWSLDF